MNFKTQFTDGYDYNDDFIGEGENFPISGLFKHAYWSFGLSFYMKKKTKFQCQYFPVNGKIYIYFG